MNVSENSQCCVCGNEAFRKLFTKKGRDFWRCTRCGMEKQHPLPTLADLKHYYDSSYKDGMYKTFVDAAGMKKLTAEHRLNEILPFCRQGRWLDVGCSNGSLVHAACNRGIDAEGIDISQVAIETGCKENLKLYCSTLEDFAGAASYDTITMFDVLEHVLDPVRCLEAARDLLRPEGRLVLSVPNQASIFRRAMGRRWYFYIPEEHLHFFNPTNIRQLLMRLGLPVERIARTYKPLTFRYSMTQFEEYNPLIYRLLLPVTRVIPERWLEKTIPLYIGEMLVISKRYSIPFQ